MLLILKMTGGCFMVKLQKDRFIIEIYTGCEPFEAWIETHYELLEILQSLDPELRKNNYERVLSLIQELMPDKHTLEEIKKQLCH